MPSITIREKDLTSAGNLEVTSNAVYIPGYANVGPVNTPTLCESFEDFQKIFGSEPYRFREDQLWPTGFNGTAAVHESMGNFYNENDYEKSYIMAAELLKLGLPVLYERCMTASDIEKWTPLVECDIDGVDGSPTDKLLVKATSPGYASSLIRFKFTKSEQVIARNSDGSSTMGTYFTLTVWRLKDTSRSISSVDPVDTNFTFNAQLADLYSSYKLVKTNSSFVDNSSLLELRFNSRLDANSSINDYLDTDGSSKEFSLQYNPELITDITKDEFKVSSMYQYLSATGLDDETKEYQGFDRLLDNGEYVIKFITSGAYPVYEYNGDSIARTMILVAANKGNCTALIDHTPNNVRDLQPLNSQSVYYAMANNFGKFVVANTHGEDAHTYAAMFTPYGIYGCNSVAKDVMLPASFGYLEAYAVQVQQYNSWLATAGCTRGLVPNLKSLCQNLTNALADSYQPRNGVAINAITNIKPYGLTIWGARTLKDNAKKGDLTATSFLNIRQLTNDVKRTTWVAAKTLTYEQNNDMLWIKFKMNITPLLNLMISSNAISGYEFKKVATTKKATVQAIIRLYAIEPVEDWDITIELADSSTEIIG